MAVDLGSVALKVTPDLKNFAPELDKGIGQSMKRVGGTMQKTGAIATGVITAPILAGFSKAANAASNLGESVNAVNVVFGKASDKIHDFAQVAAREVGLSSRQFNELVTPLGAMFQNMGFSADDAADSSINLAKRAADMASVFNVDVSEAMAAIQAGLRGQADPLEKFGVGLTAAAVDAHALEMGLADTAGELDDNAKMQARLSLLMQQTERVSGDFANTSEDVANAQRIAAARAEDLSAEFGQKLIPAKTKLIQLGSSLLDRFNNMSPAMKNTALAVGVVAAAAGPAVFALGTLIKATGNIITHGPQVVGAFGKASKAVGGFAKTALTSAGNVASAAGSMIASAVKSTASVLANIARQAAAWVMLGARATAQGARVAAAWTASAITAAVKAAASTAAQAARVVAAWVLMARRAAANAARIVAGWVATSAAAVAATATHVGQVAVQAARWAFLGVQSLLHAAKVAAAWLIAMGPIAIVTAAVVGLVVLIVRNWETIKQTIAAGWRAVTETTSRLWTAAKDFVRDRVTDMVIFVTSLPERAKAGLQSTWQTFYGHWKRVFDTVKDAVKGRIDAVIGFFRDIPKRIKNALKGLGSTVKSAFSFDLPSFKLPWGGPAPGEGTMPGGGSVIQRLSSFMASTGIGHRVTSTFRPGDKGFHGRRRAVDFAGVRPGINTPNLRAIQQAWAPMASQLKELIGPIAGLNFKNGRRFPYSPATQRAHQNHVHVAMAGGGVIDEEIFGVGRSGRTYSFGENGPETVTPGGGWRDLLEEVRALRAEVRRQTDRHTTMTRTR